MNIKIILTVFLFLITYNVLAQADSNFADSIKIYKGFYSGCSTANLRHLSSVIDTMKGITKVYLPKGTVDSLNEILSSKSIFCRR